MASSLLVRLAQIFGRRIIDQRTGECVGKAFICCRSGRIRLVGLKSDRALYPRFRTVERVTYWKREIEFSSHPEPDFPNERPDD